MPRPIERVAPRLLLGIGLILLGLVFTLDNLGLVDADDVLAYWPVLVIGVGLLKLTSHGPTVGALFWLGAGTLFLVDNLGYDVGRFWPIGLMLVGVLIITRGLFGRPPRRRGREGGGREGSNDVVSVVAFMGGVKKSSNAQSFRGGDMTAVMGGCEIDLRQASIEPGSDATLDTFAFWGGIEIKVPEDWEVETPGFAIMGGFVDETRPPSEPSGKRLVVGGMALMGGVEIKN